MRHLSLEYAIAWNSLHCKKTVSGVLAGILKKITLEKWVFCYVYGWLPSNKLWNVRRTNGFCLQWKCSFSNVRSHKLSNEKKRNEKITICWPMASTFSMSVTLIGLHLPLEILLTLLQTMTKWKRVCLLYHVVHMKCLLRKLDRRDFHKINKCNLNNLVHVCHLVYCVNITKKYYTCLM